ncbi:hypothetical protein PHYC_02979 [Phycisphaerales bacterium]|nr:hypothetical protein PHYC_02979 [Phycisphaerales bacterium]
MRTTTAALAIASFAGIVQADVIPIYSDNANSTENLGWFVGSVNYVAQTPSTGLLTISLTNTSPLANGGKITGFVFNIDSSDPAADATLATASHPFLNSGTEDASPFGTFEAGAALGGNWLGGGSPNAGIAVNSTGSFSFNIAAADAGSLAAGDFLSDGTPGFVVRFRGFENEGSDKSPAVPAPGLLTLVVGLGTVFVRNRRPH